MFSVGPYGPFAGNSVIANDEFLFVFTPLRIEGATGSPGRPLAIR